MFGTHITQRLLGATSLAPFSAPHVALKEEATCAEEAASSSRSSFC